MRCTPKVNQQQPEVLCVLESIHTHVGLGQSVIQLRTNTNVDGVSSWHNFASGAIEGKKFSRNLLVREILQYDKIWEDNLH